MPTDTPLPTSEQLDASDCNHTDRYLTGAELAALLRERNAQCRALVAKVAELQRVHSFCEECGADVHRELLQARIAELEVDLERISAIAQTRHSVGTVKHIGIREAAQAIGEVVTDLEGERDDLASLLRRMVYYSGGHGQTKTFLDVRNKAADYLKRQGWKGE